VYVRDLSISDVLAFKAALVNESAGTHAFATIVPTQTLASTWFVRYRARAHVCNSCPSKGACTDSDRGREIVRPLDPWPHSEAGRFHRGISLMLVALALLVLVVGAARNHRPDEAALLLVVLVAAVGVGRHLWCDLRARPSGFPEPAPSHGLRLSRTGD